MHTAGSESKSNKTGVGEMCIIIVAKVLKRLGRSPGCKLMCLIKSSMKETFNPHMMNVLASPGANSWRVTLSLRGTTVVHQVQYSHYYESTNLTWCIEILLRTAAHSHPCP